MGSGPTQDRQTVTQSQTQPWAPAQPLLGSILHQLRGVDPSLNGAQNQALAGLEGNAGFLGQYLPALQANTANLLAGGGAMDQAGLINNAYSGYQTSLNPYLQASYLDPRNTPGFSEALAALNNDITGQINGQFAAAGRDLSGMNAQTLARGLSQGEGALLANQYNQNVVNQLGAANALYGAGNTTAGLLSGLNQQALANQQAGIGSAAGAQQFALDPYNQMLAAEAQREGIPLGILSQLTAMGTGIAGLGQQGTQTGQQQTETNPGLYGWLGLIPSFFSGYRR